MSRFWFLRSRKPYLFLVVVLLVSVEGVMGVCGLPLAVLALVATFMVLGFVVAFLLDWWQSRRFVGQLSQMRDELKHPSELWALVDEPSRADLDAMYLALEAVSLASACDLTEEQERLREYRSYVETWVHEVKTPLAATKLVLGREPSEGASDAQRELDRALFYVDQALWYARSSNVGADYLIREVDLGHAVTEVCRQNARFLIERQAVPRIGDMEGVTVLTDEKWLVFMLTQAITNAAQYGAHTLEFSVRQELGDDGGQNVVLELRDDGRGISAADLPRVFDQGFTGSRGRQSRSSTGMGLFLCARMAKKLGLGLYIASEEGSHTRFMIFFPGDERIVSFGSLRLGRSSLTDS